MKPALRQHILACRDAIPALQRAQAGAAISRRIAQLARFRAAGCVLAYMTMGSEFDTASLVREVLAAGRVLGLPRVNRALRRLDLYRVMDPDRDLAPGTWGIREPDPERCPPLAGERVDLVLVPGVAFDAHRARLGYGGGFYDRLLAASLPRALRVAAAFSQQIVERVPVEPHDLAMDLVVTEARVYSAGEHGDPE